MRKLASTNLAIAQADLAEGAFFFAMRSCKYSKTSTKEESKRTKIIRVHNIRFFASSRIRHHDHDQLKDSNFVQITFEYMKNDDRNESVGMFRATSSSLLFPVRVWARIVKRVRSYLGDDNPNLRCVCSFHDKGKMTLITSSGICAKLRASAKAIGKAALGFDPHKIGTHSLRSGAAMALFLAHVPAPTIMIIGRWRSDAFLLYIRKQVAQFSMDLSSRMLQHADFFTVPAFN